VAPTWSFGASKGAWIEAGQHIVTIVGSNSALLQGGWLKEGRRENDDGNPPILAQRSRRTILRREVATFRRKIAVYCDCVQ